MDDGRFLCRSTFNVCKVNLDARRNYQTANIHAHSYRSFVAAMTGQKIFSFRLLI